MTRHRPLQSPTQADATRTRPTVRDLIALTHGDADAAQYVPTANPAPSLGILADLEREQRVFAGISAAAAKSTAGAAALYIARFPNSPRAALAKATS